MGRSQDGRAFEALGIYRDTRIIEVLLLDSKGTILRSTFNALNNSIVLLVHALHALRHQ